ncbi:MAG: indole-3-glycerol phosphate synthase TrpC [Spirochaetaceae bacterium]|jgi:indole-3-glycerol phosphate synthase|nr:indole-3-glycerol phosphate synthase TrpC [Spirochaetaceae bacterium]
MILDDIACAAKKRVEKTKNDVSFSAIRDAAENLPLPASFKTALGGSDMSFICEVKKASPSRGIIAENFPYIQIAKDYEGAGAAAVSVLTEPDFFKGSNDYLCKIAKEISLPVLRKDFIIDEYQIYEAAVLGAAAVLLICALLDSKTLNAYIKIARSLNLDALVEAHNEDEIKMALDCGADIIGVNNRDLKTFKVDINNSERLRPLVPRNKIFVAESGINTADDIKKLISCNVDAVLIGEAMMRSANKKEYLNMLRGCN